MQILIELFYNKGCHYYLYYPDRGLSDQYWSPELGDMELERLTMGQFSTDYKLTVKKDLSQFVVKCKKRGRPRQKIVCGRFLSSRCEWEYDDTIQCEIKHTHFRDLVLHFITENSLMYNSHAYLADRKQKTFVPFPGYAEDTVQCMFAFDNATGTWIRSCDGEEYDQEELDDFFFPFDDSFFSRSRSDDEGDTLFHLPSSSRLSSSRLSSSMFSRGSGRESDYPVHISSVYRKSKNCATVNSTKQKNEPVRTDMGTLIVYDNKNGQQKYLKFARFFSTVFKKPVDQGVCKNEDGEENHYIVINKDNNLSELDHEENKKEYFAKLVRRIIRTILQSERWNLKVKASQKENKFDIGKYMQYDSKQKCAWFISVPEEFTLEGKVKKHTVVDSMETVCQLAAWYCDTLQKKIS